MAVPPPNQIGTTQLQGAESFDSNSIGHDGPEQWRWLSLPGSRLVLNPSLITERSTPLCPALALHAGYYEGPHPQRMQHLISMRILGPDAAIKSSEKWHKKLVPGGNWAPDDAPWTFHGVAPGTTGPYGRITVFEEGDPWGWASYTIAPPPDSRSGFLRIHVPNADNAWALKIGHSTLDTDIYVQHDTHRPGTYTYDLARIPGWQGLDTFDLKFFSVGKGAAAELGSIEIELSSKDPEQGLASVVNTSWYPHQLTFTADYDNSGASIQGRDYFYDEHTIVRLLDVSAPDDSPRALVFEGQPYYEDCQVSEEMDLLQMRGDTFSYAVRFVRITADNKEVPAPVHVENSQFQWRAALPMETGNTRLALIISFAAGEEADTLAGKRARSVDSVSAQLQERKAQWDRYLAGVPAPQNFGITGIDAKGVTESEHRRAYYAAWAFVIQNVLPPMPENGYRHYQTPTGKPSLWAEGSSRAKASAAWESFFAQQLLVFVKPDIAWDAFEGLMMQVDVDGWLDGEVLPSRKAQTAWILYAHTGARERLEKVYPPISRYLRWREKNPRWIYKDHDDPDQRDSNFADSLLLDLEFAILIAEELGRDAEEWRAMTARATDDYLRWFFHEDLPHPIQYFYKNTGERHAGHATWVCSGLYLDGLPGWADQALLDLFYSMYDPDHDLAGLDFCKHPIASMIVHGLRKKGLDKEADGYLQAVLRDVIRATRFSENYSFDPLRSWGVEDSMFGAATVIEFTLLRNGLRIDRGTPAPL